RSANAAIAVVVARVNFMAIVSPGARLWFQNPISGKPRRTTVSEIGNWGHVRIPRLRSEAR
ncbi:MAG TPA: hypothetical protein VII42_14020, partial [Caulobacteraceae bacterium]